MSTARTATLITLVLVLCTGGTWWALHGDEEPEPAETLVTKEMTPFEKRQGEHLAPWPFKEFEKDIADIHAGGGVMDPNGETDKSYRMTVRIEEQDDVYSFHCKDATVKEVVAQLGALLKPLDIRVFTYDDPEIAEMVSNNRFTIDLDNVRFFEIIDHIRGQSGERVKYYMTSLGLVIGGEAAVQKAQIQAIAATAKANSLLDRGSPILDTEYRPDFADATIGAVQKTIKEQTGIQVVVDADTWASGKKLTWRAEPMTLREVLDGISEKIGCVYRVRSGRIFLLAPR